MAVDDGRSLKHSMYQFVDSSENDNKLARSIIATKQIAGESMRRDRYVCAGKRTAVSCVNV